MKILLENWKHFLNEAPEVVSTTMRVKKFGAFGGDGFMITLLGSTEDGGSVAPGNMIVQEIATYTSKDKFRKMPACREDLEKLKEMGYEAERFFYVDKARVGEGFRNQGFGKKLYNGAFEEMRKQIGQPFIIMPTWCLGSGGTSQAARRVWDSITRDHISSGHVIYIP